MHYYLNRAVQFDWQITFSLLEAYLSLRSRHKGIGEKWREFGGDRGEGGKGAPKQSGSTRFI